MELKNKIREKRFFRNQLSQADLAEAVEVSRQTIIAIESGKFNPSVKLALQLARYFKCPLEDVFYLEDAKNDEEIILEDDNV